MPRRCPVCDAEEAEPHWRKTGLVLVRCRTCGMVYANPVPAELATGRFYEDCARRFYLSPTKLESDYAPTRFERELRLFRRHCAGGSVLDVGCSTGAFLRQLQSLGGYAVTGTDVAGEALEYAARQGVEVLRAPFLTADYGARRFDAITLWAVLEHVVDPRAFLTRAAALLPPGGLCFVLVPNFASLAVRLLGWRYRYVMPDHVNYFTAATFRALVARDRAFDVLEVRFTHFNPVVWWQDLWRGGTERVPDEERARLLQRTTALKQHPWLKPARLIYALAEAILARGQLADNLVVVLRRRHAVSSPCPLPTGTRGRRGARF